jgi:2'-5' RNA ligase
VSEAQSVPPAANAAQRIPPIAQGLSIHPPRAVEQRLHWALEERGIPHPTHFHLTLKYPFLPLVDLSGPFEQLERLIASRPALALSSTGMLASRETYCHLLLLRQAPELMRLHAEIMAVLGGCGPAVNPMTSLFEGAGYNPHLTLSYGSSVAEFEIRDALFAEWEPNIRFEAKSVELYEKDLDGESPLARGSLSRSFRFAEPR